MPYPNNPSMCVKICDHPNEVSDDGGMLAEYKGVGSCDACPLRSSCSGPELFGLHQATFELRHLQADLNSMSLLTLYPRCATGG